MSVKPNSHEFGYFRESLRGKFQLINPSQPNLTNLILFRVEYSL
jgi:hypothetical protein